MYCVLAAVDIRKQSVRDVQFAEIHMFQAHFTCSFADFVLFITSNKHIVVVFLLFFQVHLGAGSPGDRFSR